LFGRIERLISQPQIFVGCVFNARNTGGHANTDGQMDISLRAHSTPSLNRCPKIVQPPDHFLPVIVTGENYKLLASEPG
jgi:hypothetical protein